MAKAKAKPALPRIVRVESNIKSPTGEPWSLDLSESKTLLYGSNTSHKSAVVHAIELALTGAADDVAGRMDVRDSALLLTLAPADQLTAEVVWDHGVASTYTVERKGKTVKKPVHNTGENATLPLRQVRAVLSGSPAKARKAFLGWAADDVTLDDVLAHMPSQLHARYQDIAEKRTPKASAVAALVAVGDYTEQRRRACAKEAKGAQVIIDQIGGGLPARPTDAELVHCREALLATERVYEAAVKASGAPARVDIDIEATVRELSAAEHAVAAWLRAVTRLEAELYDLGSPRDAAALELLSFAVEDGIDQCPACSSHVGSVHLSACRGFYAEQMGERNAKLAELDAAQRTLAAWETEESRLIAVRTLAEAQPVEAVVSVVSIEDAKNRLYAAQQALSSLETAVSRWGDMSAARDKATAMEADVSSYKALASACSSAVGALLATQTKAFCAKVQRYLPKAWVFHVELSEGGRQTFRMGLLRGEKLHCALSGVEWATVTTAVAAATVESGAAVLVPEDRAWDPRTLKSVMQAFAAFPGQVVLASTTRPSGRVPKGWDMIDMDAWLKAQQTAEETQQEESKSDDPAELPAPPAPPAPVQFSSRSKRLLSGLGFETDQIGLMTAQTAAEVIKVGLLANQVRVNSDGSWSYRGDSPTLSMPSS